MSEDKLRLEYEFKQLKESTGKQLADIRAENENLQLEINEKMSMNKKLYTDNNSLYRTVENRNLEIQSLRDDLENLNDRLEKLLEDKANLEKMVFFR